MPSDPDAFVVFNRSRIFVTAAVVTGWKSRRQLSKQSSAGVSGVVRAARCSSWTILPNVSDKDEREAFGVGWDFLLAVS